MVGVPHGTFRDRMLRAALPTLEEFPHVDEWDEDEDLLRVLSEVGAPSLKHLYLYRLNPGLKALQMLVNTPEGFEQLQDLEFDFCGPDCEDTQDLLREFHRFSKLLTDSFWPHLQELSVSDIILGGERWQELIDALITRRGEVASLQKLMFWKVRLTDEDIDVLADAFTEGCFSHMKRLQLTDEDGVTDRGAARLAEVLHYAPLLETLRLFMTAIRGARCGALAFAVVTDCPAIKELWLPRQIEQQGRDIINGIISSANLEGPLTVKFR